ncbi:hypothetical protein LB507_001641 [Fusarium sp. FIESC RH6]|nr:hypothetical protein LB507_001641 [Fusarium sp. FIESC RH6]
MLIAFIDYRCLSRLRQFGAIAAAAISFFIPGTCSASNSRKVSFGFKGHQMI